MKLLVVSHSIATPVNQQFFAAVEQATGWSLVLVGPSNWRDDYGAVRSLERGPGFGGPLRALPVWGSGNVPLHVYRSTFTSLLRAERPDAIFVHHEPYAAATAQVYAANALSVRRPIGFFSWQNLQKRYPAPFRWTEQMVYRASSFACPGSRSAEAVLREKGYDGPATLMPAGIDPVAYAPHPEAAALGARLRRHPGEVLLGYVGRVTEAKGLPTLLQALRHVQALPWRLVVVGTGDYDAAFDEEARRLGLDERITRTGYVPHEQAPQYLAAFDGVVLPSETQPNWKEQFGRVLIEALACGTPLVGSDSGEIPHVIRDTRGGLVFPEGEAEALAERLRRLIEHADLRAELAQRGRRRVLARYTNAAIATRFAEGVERACSSAPFQEAPSFGKTAVERTAPSASATSSQTEPAARPA